MTTHASAQYETARNTRAFNVTGFCFKRSNQYGTRYKFPDGSWLACNHHSTSIAHGNSHGEMLAIRKLWDDRPGGAERQAAYNAMRGQS